MLKSSLRQRRGSDSLKRSGVKVGVLQAPVARVDEALRVRLEATPGEKQLLEDLFFCDPSTGDSAKIGLTSMLKTQRHWLSQSGLTERKLQTNHSEA